MTITFKMKKGEHWWGGTSVDGEICPFDENTNIERDFRICAMNQTMPMYISDMGRCIWSDSPFKVTFSHGEMKFEGEAICIKEYGSTLRDAYIGAMREHFPITGNKLPMEFFKTPQYNTWMQYTYNPTQEGILRYAKDIINNGFEPGIFIIDEGWQIDYGHWDFDPYKIPDPKSMIKQLHDMGFTVMLWIVPNVRCDGDFFVKHTLPNLNPAEYDKLFVRNESGEIAITEWWNGFSATLDMTKECDRRFLDIQLERLMKDYDVDGFKFDGGTLEHYSGVLSVNVSHSDCILGAKRNIAWNDFGARYSFHEFKDTFKGGGKRCIQRIRDKTHTWDGDGINKLVPCAILQGLIGHPFICPDMIGGGEWTTRELNVNVDSELFVRMAQASALFPMMQFSWAPWEALDAENLSYVKKAHDLHIKFSDLICRLVEEAEITGEPILRNYEYNYPHSGYYGIKDTFMLGNEIIVAPVLEKNKVLRDVVLPKGVWIYEDGTEYEGGRIVSVNADKSILPYFVKK